MNVRSLILLLIAMASFSISWFPLLYVEIILSEDAGKIYFPSMIINICALFIGMVIMFDLMRRMSLDAIDQFEVIQSSFDQSDQNHS
jgi:hypothetical protein